MAIGGFDGSSYLKTCEVYDAEANCWKVSCSMIYRRLGGGVGVVKMQKEKEKSDLVNGQKSAISQNSSWPLILSPVPSLLANVPQNQIPTQGGSINTPNSFSSTSIATITSSDNSLISDFSGLNTENGSSSNTNPISNGSPSSSLIVNTDSSSPSSLSSNLSFQSTSNQTNMTSQKNTVKLVDL